MYNVLMTLDGFISHYQGQAVSYDGVAANRGQCVQLVEFYLTQVVEPTPVPFYGNAIDWFNKFGGILPDYFTKAPYIVGTYPQVGDLVVWSSALPNSGGFGHVDICTKNGDAVGFTSFASNWNGEYAHEVTHNYSYIIGYLRLKENNMPTLVDQNIAADLAAGILFREGAAQTDPAYLASVVGQPVEDVIRSLVNSAEHKAIVARLEAPTGDPTATDKLTKIKTIVES